MKISVSEIEMEKRTMNNNIQRAVWLLWVTVGIGAIVTLIDKWTGYIGEGEFAIGILFYGLVCIIPYKISQGSNAARYVFVVLVGISILLSLGMSVRGISALSLVAGIVELILDAIILFWLFQKDSSYFFEKESVK